jgi:isochorismate hydrolase
VALGGFLTNCCVESTMRSAYERGYDVVTLTDCVAATSQEEHDNAIACDYPMFSRPMSSEEFNEARARAKVQQVTPIEVKEQLAELPLHPPRSPPPRPARVRC